MPIPPTQGVLSDGPVAVERTRCLLCAADDGVGLVESAAQMSPRRDRFTFVRCRGCGLIYLNPRIPERDIGDWYGPDYLPHRGDAAWGRYAPFVARGQRMTDRARVRTVIGAAPLGPDTRALDVGCGRPTFLEALHRRTGAHGTGIDFSDAGWRDAPERWRAAGLDLRHGRLEATALDGHFDLLTLWHALEHDYRPLATLERAGWRVIRQPRSGTLDPYVLWWLGQNERTTRGFAGSLETRFPGFMAGKVATLPLALAGRWVRLGVQLAVATTG